MPPLLGVNQQQATALLGHRSSEEARCFSSSTHSVISRVSQGGPFSPSLIFLSPLRYPQRRLHGASQLSLLSGL